MLLHSRVHAITSNLGDGYLTTSIGVAEMKRAAQVLEGELIGRGPDQDATDLSYPEAIQKDMFGTEDDGEEKGDAPLVYKRNEIIHGHFALKTLALKVFSAIVSKHDPRSKEFHPINISRSEMGRLVQVSRQTMYEMADSVTSELKHVILKVPYIDKNWEATVQAEKIAAKRENREPVLIPKPDPRDRDSFAKEHLFEIATYNAKAGVMTFKFNDNLLDYLIDIRGNFTYYQLRSVLSMSSSHAIRIYEILRSALSLKSVQSGTRIAYKTVGYDELRSMLSIDPKAYPKFAHFERSVLRKAQEQMRDCDLGFTYTLPERIAGNRQTPVKTIRFKIIATAMQENSDDWKLVFTEVFTDNARKKLRLEFSKDRIQRNIEFYMATEANVTSPSGWIREAIKRDYSGLNQLKTCKHIKNPMHAEFISDQLEKTWLSLDDATQDEFLESGFEDTGVSILYEGYRMLRSRQESSKRSASEKRAAISDAIMNPDDDF